MGKPLSIFGVPLIGVILPYIGKRRIYLNRDGSMVDTGQHDILDERGWPLKPRTLVYRTDTGKVVDNPEFDEAGPA